ncbi:hypothetical protein OSTOST_15031, partial [Ostertagia ostertagi]
MVMVSLAAMTTGLVMRVHRMGRYGKEPKEWLLRVFCLRPLKTKINTRAKNATELGREERSKTPPSWRDNASVKDPVLRSAKGEIDDFDVDDPTAIRRRREANGYVRISERLDLSTNDKQLFPLTPEQPIAWIEGEGEQ